LKARVRVQTVDWTKIKLALRLAVRALILAEPARNAEAVGADACVKCDCLDHLVARHANATPTTTWITMSAAIAYSVPVSPNTNEPMAPKHTPIMKTKKRWSHNAASRRCWRSVMIQCCRGRPDFALASLNDNTSCALHQTTPAMGQRRTWHYAPATGFVGAVFFAFGLALAFAVRRVRLNPTRVAMTIW